MSIIYRSMMFVDGRHLEAAIGRVQAGCFPDLNAVRVRLGEGISIYPKPVLVRTMYYTSRPKVGTPDRELKDLFLDYVSLSYCADLVLGGSRKRHKDSVNCSSCGTKNQVPYEEQKQVDVHLAVDMLLNAHLGNYDVAILIAGDEDFVPVIRAVKLLGKLVVLWAEKGSVGKDLELVKAADWYQPLACSAGDKLWMTPDQLRTAAEGAKARAQNQERP